MTPLGAAPLLLLLAQATASAEAALPYRVGSGDVLEVAVEGRPDLSRLPTVQTTGRVWLPRAGEVEVRGLTTDEIAARVAPLLAGEGLPAPRVSVRVREYNSQFVWVRGALMRPGRKPLRSGSRLVDALLDAGGFQPGASGEVTLERANGTLPDGSRAATFRFAGDPTPEGLERRMNRSPRRATAGFSSRSCT
jgi:protein involved in polysaccharide export with SLBB domain